MAVRADDVDLIRDRTLVESCQSGDPSAFADLYERYYQRLYRFCLRRVRSAHEAEEITQEAFARAYTAMPRFAGERRFYPWLTVIASRLCVDSHRREARTEPAAEIDTGFTDGGHQGVIDAVDRELLTQALGNLGPRHREVLALRENEGWSYQQIADHYGVTMGTVEALLFRARKALRREFLAAAGDGRLAALPLLGAALARLTSWRLKAQQWVEHAHPVSAAAAGAAAVVAVVGGVAVVSPPDQTTAPQEQSVVRLETASLEPLDAPPALTLDGTTSGQATVAAAPPVAPARPSVAQAAVRPLSEGSAAEGHGRTAEDPTRITVAGVTISTDLDDPEGQLPLR